MEARKETEEMRKIIRSFYSNPLSPLGTSILVRSTNWKLFLFFFQMEGETEVLRYLGTLHDPSREAKGVQGTE